ncbi:MAG: MMPL family transporter [Anaerolineae bacterium]|nr:MMPL family transporter [Anaerolineae bacterium]
MFETIGKFSARFRYPIIVAWGVLLVVVTLLAPNMADVVTTDQSSYLPADEPSVVAARVAGETFPDQASPSQAVLVIESDNGSVRDPAAMAYLEDLTEWVKELPREVVGTTLSPVDPNLADRLISEDGQAAMVFVALHTSLEDQKTLDMLDQMQARLDAAPDGLAGYVTGSVAIMDEYKSGALESADSTTVITIALVITILLIIYRSPVSPIIPLVTIGAAFLISRGLVAWLGTFGLSISSLTEVFMVVLLFGAGTDYCLFLVSRFREYMADDLPGPEAARHTVGRVGETITSSAGTVIVGMVAMSFAEMGLFANTGPALAIGVAVALLAGLTLTPALLAVLGKWAFWPGGARHAVHGAFWGRLARWITSRPWVPLALALLILVPLAIYGQGMPRNFDLLSDLPDDAPSKVGFQVLSKHFGAGEMQPLDLIVTDMPAARSPEGLAYVEALTDRLLNMEGVADVRSLTLPAGRLSPELGESLRVETQLTTMVEMIDELRAGMGDLSALADLDLDETADGLDLLRAYLNDLAATFPDLEAEANYRAAQGALDSLGEALEEGKRMLLVSSQLDEMTAGLSSATIRPAEESATTPAALDEAREQFELLRTYLSGLAADQPAAAGLDGYDEALTALDRLDATLDEVNRTLLVSTQLDLLAQEVEGMATALQDPAALDQLAAAGDRAGATLDQEQALAMLDAYLGELVAAYPDLAEHSSFEAVAEHLAAVEMMAAELSQARLVSVQLGRIASEMDATAAAIDENPYAVLPQPGEPSAGQQMSVLNTYLEELGSEYPLLAATEEYRTAISVTVAVSNSLETIDLTQLKQLIPRTQASLAVLSAAFAGMSAIAADTLPEAVFVPEDLPAEMGGLTPDLGPLVAEVEAVGQAFATLAEFARQEMPEATFVPESDLSAMGDVPDPRAGLASALDDLGDAFDRLATAAAVEMPAATYLPSGDLVAGEAAGEATAAVLAEVDGLQAALGALADDFSQRSDGYLVPEALAAEAGEDLGPLLDTYTTPDGKVARLQIVLDSDPFSVEAMDTVTHLRSEVSQASVGYISGTTATNLDLRDVMDRDFYRVMLLVIGGILIVLIVLLRSFVAPVYMMATILLSYGATLGITRLVFDGILNEGLTWFVPFLIFVVLVALGMDYNIFLMGRVKEEVAIHDTRTGIERAVERTGGIITSAGIIMAGTFAAMMSSSLLGLLQTAFAITVGMLLDTFIIRTTLVPAIATFLGRWNWWPGKEPGR